MLVLFSVQVVQTNNNESNWREEKTIFLCKPEKEIQTCQKSKKILIKNYNWQNTQVNI
jgi:hypothetical protein